MNQARHDRHFPNPILRLGQGHANFKRLTSNQVLTQVSAFVKANKANQPRIDGELKDRRDQLKAQIKGTIDTLGHVRLAAIAEVYRLEERITSLATDVVPALQAIDHESLLPLLERISSGSSAYSAYLEAACPRALADKVPMSRRIALDAAIVSLDGKFDGAALGLFPRLDDNGLRRLGAWMLQFQQLRMPVVGYLFRGAAVRAIEFQLNTELNPKRPILLKRDARALQRLVEVANDLRLDLPEEHLSERELPEVYEALSLRRIPPQGALDARQFMRDVAFAFSGGFPASVERGGATRRALGRLPPNIFTPGFPPPTRSDRRPTSTTSLRSRSLNGSTSR